VTNNHFVSLKAPQNGKNHKVLLLKELNFFAMVEFHLN
jgi:hypothetical protein